MRMRFITGSLAYMYFCCSLFICMGVPGWLFCICLIVCLFVCLFVGLFVGLFVCWGSLRGVQHVLTCVLPCPSLLTLYLLVRLHVMSSFYTLSHVWPSWKVNEFLYSQIHFCFFTIAMSCFPNEKIQTFPLLNFFLACMLSRSEFLCISKVAQCWSSSRSG